MGNRGTKQGEVVKLCGRVSFTLDPWDSSLFVIRKWERSCAPGPPEAKALSSLQGKTLKKSSNPSGSKAQATVGVLGSISLTAILRESSWQALPMCVALSPCVAQPGSVTAVRSENILWHRVHWVCLQLKCKSYMVPVWKLVTRGYSWCCTVFMAPAWV